LTFDATSTAARDSSIPGRVGWSQHAGRQTASPHALTAPPCLAYCTQEAAGPLGRTDSPCCRVACQGGGSFVREVGRGDVSCHHLQMEMPRGGGSWWGWWGRVTHRATNCRCGCQGEGPAVACGGGRAGWRACSHLQIGMSRGGCSLWGWQNRSGRLPGKGSSSTCRAVP
jgi:hypothetical protein